MNLPLIETIFGMSLAFTMCHLFYWQVVYPAIIGILRARLERLSMEIDATAADLCGGDAEDRRAVRRFAEYCRHLNGALDLDIVDARASMARPEIMAQVAIDLQMAENSPAVNNVLLRCYKIFVAVILTNSPLYLPCFVVIIVGSFWFYRARVQFVKLQQASLAAALLPGGPMVAA